MNMKSFFNLIAIVSILLIIILVITISGCNNNTNIYKALLNKEIFVYLGFAGNSFELIKEGNRNYVKRLILGSGIPVIGKVMYRIEKSNENSIYLNKSNLEIDQSNLDLIGENENIKISLIKNKIHIYNNDKELEISSIIQK